MHRVLAMLVACAVARPVLAENQITIGWSAGPPAATGVRYGCLAPGQYERTVVPINGAVAGSVTIKGFAETGTCYFALSSGPQDEWFLDLATLKGGQEPPGPVSALSVTWSPTPAGISARYVRWSVSKRRGADDAVQVADLQPMLGSSPVAWPAGVIATNPGGSNPTPQRPAMLVDGNAATKVYDANFNRGNDGSLTGSSVFVIDAGVALTFDGMRYRTAEDRPNRDPVSWKLETSDNGTTWTLRDQRADQAVSTARSAFTAVFQVH